jgi:hypothetical protein
MHFLPASSNTPKQRRFVCPDRTCRIVLAFVIVVALIAVWL